MDLSRDLFVILFLGVLALASGVQIGWGIHALRRRDWFWGITVMLQGLFIPLVLVLLGDERFLPPSVSIFALSIVAIIFVGSILAQIWFLPLLVESFGQENITALGWGGGFLVGGAAFALIGTLQNNTVTGICGGIFIGGLGAALFIPGVRDIIQRAFGSKKPAPVRKPKTKRALKNAPETRRTP